MVFIFVNKIFVVFSFLNVKTYNGRIHQEEPPPLAPFVTINFLLFCHSVAYYVLDWIFQTCNELQPLKFQTNICCVCSGWV